MIIDGHGGLLKSGADALVNTVNTVGVMGKGIALQFKRVFPENFKAYAAACRSGDVEIGRMFVVPTSTLGGPRWLINFPTKRHWRGHSKLEWIETGLDDLVSTVQRLGIRSIAVPPLGAGNGGLDWDQVRPLIVQKLGSIHGVDVILFAPVTAHRPLAGKALRMTWGRAALIRLLEAYVDSRASTEPWSGSHGASALELHKLMYFANLVEPRLRLTFDQGKYGPYSEQVRHLIQDMEGTFLHGFGDGASPVLNLDPIGPTSAGSKQAGQLDAEHGDGITAGIVKPTIEILQGFEGAYGLELLATVHWVWTHQDPRGNADTITALVRRWSERKGRLFTQEHVTHAMERLGSNPVTAH